MSKLIPVYVDSDKHRSYIFGDQDTYEGPIEWCRTRGIKILGMFKENGSVVIKTMRPRDKVIQHGNE